MSGIKVTNERPARPIPESESVDGVDDGIDGTDWEPNTTSEIPPGNDPGDVLTWDGDSWEPEPGGSALTVKDEGTPLATAATSLDFVGPGVTASGAGAAKTVTIPGISAITAHTYELANEGGDPLLSAHGSTGATETIDPTLGNVHTLTLNANCTVTLSAPTGSAASLELWFTQDGTGGWAITWAGSVSELGTPETTAGVTNIAIATTKDGGTTWVVAWVGGGEPTADAHLVDTTDAHDASAISVLDTGAYYAGADVEAVLAELPALYTAAAVAAAAAAAGSHVHVVDCLFSGDGSTTAWLLPAVPFDQYSVAAYVSGVLTEVTLSGTLFDTATFGAAPASATNNIRFDIVAATV